MPAWMTRWRSILGALIVFTVLALTLGALGAKLILRDHHDSVSTLHWVEICTDAGTRLVLMDLGVPR
ncbi:hypothetical protein CCO03_01470 [Comamonas serinivorans]|uniref:Uncharacterized protein n=1 Tax=Comamonas serinivorans TaxID=1082851 RepID=A0A1Y0EJI5_9BURK|nr:hypothetical protein [Comamonas serinivorans]ARU03529.1 hypothetical protein CCO03_01470 [Comamonas serinivorans]